MPQDSVILLGNYRPTLTLARSLSALGYRVIVTRGGGEGCSEWSRFVDECWDHPPIEDATAFFAALDELLRQRPDIRIVYPVWERCVAGLAAYRHMLPADRIYAAPDPRTVVTCLDKLRMLELSVRCGVPCADFAVVETYEALRHEADRIGFPIVIRPLSSSLSLNGGKVITLRSADELDAQLPVWPRGHTSLIVQEFVTGPRHNIYFAAQQGRPIRFLAAEILRTHKADGSGLAVDGRTIPLAPKIQDHCTRLIQALDYHGVGCVQFMVDPDAGKVSFLELNPRIAGNHAIAEACGLELGRLSIDLARDPDGDERLTIGPAGRRYVWTYGDFRGIREQLARDEMGWEQALAAAVRALWLAVVADVHMTWRWNDPLPPLALFAQQMFKRNRPAAPDAGARRPAASTPTAQG